MKLSKKLEKLMNEQISHELHAAYLYLGISVAMGAKAFHGTETWMYAQWKEEIEHSMRFLNYLGERGAAVELLPVEGVSTQYGSPAEAFKAALEHEKKITQKIHDMYDLAVSEKDYESQQMLDWFIKEQIEEEEQTQYFVDRLALAGKDNTAILLIDKEAGERK